VSTTFGNIFLDAYDVPTTAVEAYEVSDVKAVINNATATNYGAAAATLTVYIVADGGSAAGLTKTTVSKSMAPGETVILSELIGRPILTGGTIQAESDTVTTISLSVGGTITTA